MRPEWMDLDNDSDIFGSREFDVAEFLAIVREREPLTLPEILEALPPKFQTPGAWRLLVATHPRVVLWDGLSEATAGILCRLFETQQLALQPCHAMIYQFAERRLDLPAVHAIPVFQRSECWLPCTIGIGPVACLNSQWKIGYGAARNAN